MIQDGDADSLDVMKRVSPSLSGAVRLFSFWIANGTAGHPLLDDVDYACIFEEPSALEATYAIFMNCLELDDDGTVLNAKAAERRAAEYILAYCTGKQPERAFEQWEVELY
ncbi:MAG: hypothetical protein AB7S68_33305 [Polyangiaceae bacterium]